MIAKTFIIKYYFLAKTSFTTCSSLLRALKTNFLFCSTTTDYFAKYSESIEYVTGKGTNFSTWNFNNHKTLIKKRDVFFDSTSVAPGPPAMRLKNGNYLLLYISNQNIYIHVRV